MGQYPLRGLTAVLGWVVLLLIVPFYWADAANSSQGPDAFNYWFAWGYGALYANHPIVGDHIGYLYSPAFAQAIWPLTHLPFDAFRLVWAALSAITFAWLLAPAPWSVRIPFLAIAGLEIVSGSIYWLIGLTLVSTLSLPALWVIPALTKVTPGIGALWYVGAREWRRAAVAFGAGLLVVAISFVVYPGAWPDWFHLLSRNAGTNAVDVQGFVPNLPVRAVAAAILAVAAGYSGRLSPLVLVALLAQPDVNPATFSVLCALPRTMIADSGRDDHARVFA